MTGKLFVLEGGEGSGKTSVIQLLKDFLESTGRQVLLTREPGGVKIAEQIRSIILDVKNTEIDAKTEALLYAAARSNHLITKVIPALRQGKIVICDRFVDSSLVYQGYARGLGIDEVFELNKFAIGEYMPDLTFFLDVVPEIGLQRIAINKEREVNRLDIESLEFHSKVREGYLEVLKRYPGRIRRVDANQSIEVVFEQIKSILEDEVLS